MTKTELQNKTQILRGKIEMAATTMSDESALTAVELFPKWAIGVRYILNDRVQHNSVLYKCVQEHTAQSDWTPDVTPALWVVVSVEEFPDWHQPEGAHDAYNIGDKCSYNGKHWICTVNGNIYAPGVYGWEKVS